MGSSPSEWQIHLCAWNSPQGVLKISEGEPHSQRDEDDMAASILVSRFARGVYNDLGGVITLRPGIRNALRSLLSIRDIDEAGLSAQIRAVNEPTYIRVLIDIAGLARSNSCVETICERLIRDGRTLNSIIRGQGYLMRSFYDVAIL